MAGGVDDPTNTSRRLWVAANTMASAATSGWYAPDALASWPVLLRAQSNCGVFTAGRCTMVRCSGLRLCSSSDRSASVKPRRANLAPQYAPWIGMARQASTELTCTMVPPRIRFIAASVPFTAPRYVTSVTRRTSSGSMSRSSL